MIVRPLHNGGTAWVRTTLCCLSILFALVAATLVVADERSEGSGDVTTSAPRKAVLVPERRAETPEVRQVLAPPVEDTCAGAQVIPGAGPFPYLTTPVDATEATDGAPEPTPAAAPCNLPTVIDDYSRGIWFSFTPTVTAPYSFTTCPALATENTLTDTVLGIFTSPGGSCGGPFTQLGTACNDDAGANCAPNGRASLLAGVVLNAGTTYYILSWRWDDADGGEPGQVTQLHVDKTPPPANDTCEGAIALSLNQSRPSTLVAGENNYTLDTSGGTACFSGIGHVPSTAPGRDAVFSFTAPAAGKYSFKGTSQGAAGGNNVVYTTSTCPAAPAAFTCDASVQASNRSTTAGNLSGSEEVYCRTMAADETVYFFMDEGNVTGAGGTFYAEVIQCDQESEPNDTPAQANATTFQPVEGTILIGDADFWSIGAPPAGSRVFAVVDGVSSNPAATTADFDMRVTNATDTLEYDDGDNTSIHGSFCPNIAGRALDGTPSYLRVNHFNAAGNFEPYRLYSTVQPPGTDPYGSSSTAEVGDAPATLGGSQSAGNGYFSGTHLNTTSTNGFDQDFYHFCAVAGEVIQLGVDADPGRNLTPYSPALFLFNSAGAQITGLVDGNSVSNNTSGAGDLSASTPNSPGLPTVFRAQTTGVYYTMVESFGATPPNGNDYLLSIGRSGQPHANDSATVVTELTTDSPTGTSGEEIIYVVHMENNGVNSSLDTEFTFEMPEGVPFDGIAGTGTDGATCSLLPPAGGSGTVRCRVECLRAGGFFDFFIFGFAPQCKGDGFLLEASVSVTSKTALTGDSVLTGSTTTPISDPGTCDDGLFCTAGDACNAGACEGSFACEDNDPCTIDQCSELDGCDNQFAEGNLCDDGDACTLIDICLTPPNPGDDPCVGFEPLTCDDGATCTDDTCSSEVPGECVYTPADCEDGDACTTNSCDEGTGCVSTPIVCDDGSACTADSCDSGTGCVYTPIVCDDGNGCTTDTCDDGTGCVYSPVVCDDGDVCTADSCSDGACVYDPIPGCGVVCESTDNPKNLAYWKRLCRGQTPGGDTITLADASCVASQGDLFASVDEVKDICDVLNGDVGISNSCSRANAEVMALAMNVCHQRVCDSSAIDSGYSDNTTVGESYDEADDLLSNPTGSGCQLASNLAKEITGGRALSSFVGSSSDTPDATIEPEDRRIRTLLDR